VEVNGLETLMLRLFVTGGIPMMLVKTSEITQYYLDCKGNSSYAAYMVLLNYCANGQGKSSPSSQYPSLTIEEITKKTVRLQDLQNGHVNWELLPSHFTSPEFRMLGWIVSSFERTALPISLIGKSLRLIVTLLRSDGIMNVTIHYPSDTTETIKEWSSDVLLSFKSVEHGRQTVIRAF
jgi:hypothetical protein